VNSCEKTGQAGPEEEIQLDHSVEHGSEKINNGREAGQEARHVKEAAPRDVGDGQLEQMEETRYVMVDVKELVPVPVQHGGDAGVDGRSYQKDGQSYQKDGLSYQKDDQSYQKNGQSYLKDGLSYQKDGQSYQKDGLSYQKDDQSYQKDGQSYQKDGQSYQKDDQSYLNDGQSYQQDVHTVEDYNQETDSIQVYAQDGEAGLHLGGKDADKDVYLSIDLSPQARRHPRTKVFILEGL
jgi:hypothetical protein